MDVSRRWCNPRVPHIAGQQCLNPQSILVKDGDPSISTREGIVGAFRVRLGLSPRQNFLRPGLISDIKPVMRTLSTSPRSFHRRMYTTMRAHIVRQQDARSGTRERTPQQQARGESSSWDPHADAIRLNIFFYIYAQLYKKYFRNGVDFSTRLLLRMCLVIAFVRKEIATHASSARRDDC